MFWQMKNILLGGLGTKPFSCNSWLYTSCLSRHKVFVVAAGLEVTAPGKGEQSIFSREKFVKNGLSENR